MSWVALVVAKAPVPGRVKTRLSPPLNRDQAADLAAAALLDTIALAERAVGGDPDRVVIALAGDLADGARPDALAHALRRWRVVPQQGADLGERLAEAHQQVARLRPGQASVQIGMDTPQVSPSDLRRAAMRLSRFDAVVGAADDGGWWLLALRDPTTATVLRGVPMSRPTTARDTRRALGRHGSSLAAGPLARDIDTWSDALAVARLAPGTLTGAVVGALVQEHA